MEIFNHRDTYTNMKSQTKKKIKEKLVEIEDEVKEKIDAQRALAKVNHARWRSGLSKKYNWK